MSKKMYQFENPQIIKPEFIFVEKLLESPAKLVSLTGDIGFKNKICDKNLHRPQLALAGFTELFTYNRVQICGNTEIQYLTSLSEEEKIKSFAGITQFPVPCIIVTNGHPISTTLIDAAIKADICIFSSNYETTDVYSLISEFLVDQFAEQMSVHGSFVDIYGIGMLFVGKSGIGKSEITLDLVERGHRLVADDVVIFTKRKEDVLMGTGTDIAGHFMEIRGLGIIDVKAMFGLKAIRFQKRLEVIVELENWEQGMEYTRTGLENEPVKILDVNVNYIKLPIIPGKNITVISEVIAINYLMNTYGHNAAQSFSDSLMKKIENRKKHPKAFEDIRMVKYFLDEE
jgi:HPr kinase/phosphorylase